MLVVIGKILRNTGRKADREMPAIILCDRILLHTANDQPQWIQYSMTPNSRKHGNIIMLPNLGGIWKGESISLSLSCD